MSSFSLLDFLQISKCSSSILKLLFQSILLLPFNSTEVNCKLCLSPTNFSRILFQPTYHSKRYVGRQIKIQKKHQAKSAQKLGTNEVKDATRSDQASNYDTFIQLYLSVQFERPLQTKVQSSQTNCLPKLPTFSKICKQIKHSRLNFLGIVPFSVCDNFDQGASCESFRLQRKIY